MCVSVYVCVCVASCVWLHVCGVESGGYRARGYMCMRLTISSLLMQLLLVLAVQNLQNLNITFIRE